MTIFKILLTMIIAVLGFFFFLGGNSSGEGSYRGTAINSSWSAQDVCQTARAMIKYNFRKSEQDLMYSTTCTVTKVHAPLPGQLSFYDPYAVSWPDGMAARVFITDTNGLKVAGISKSGIPSSWR